MSAVRISQKVADDSEGAACYPNKVLKSSPWTKFFLLLSLIALISQITGRAPEVTVSGLALGLERRQVIDQLGQPDFQSGYPEVNHIEYWKSVPLALDFDQHNRLSRIEGGVPMFDGEPVSSLSLEAVERRLGPALRRDQRADGQPVLRYEKQGLLVTRDDQGELTFLLFRPRTRP